VRTLRLDGHANAASAYGARHRLRQPRDASLHRVADQPQTFLQRLQVAVIPPATQRRAERLELLSIVRAEFVEHCHHLGSRRAHLSEVARKPSHAERLSVTRLPR